MRHIIQIEFSLPDNILSAESGVTKLQDAMTQIESIAKEAGATVSHDTKRYRRQAKPVIPGADPKYASPQSDANLVHEDQPGE